ncbi:MAG: DJ-1/PfpI/YhbO family deglycase/protease [Candidatus Altiarchaeales archaeon]|nr:DJ-1/PfpI/YhbO family deglycase/protease [Candidatus Altiarchaeales archaeon]
MRALILSEDGFEDTELLSPYYRLLEEGLKVDIASTRRKKIRGKHGYEVQAELAFEEVDPKHHQLLVLPGGRAPEKIRLSEDAKRISQYFMVEGKLIGTICHGVQTLISAGLVKNRRGTCFQGIQDDLDAAGCEVVDEEVVVDDNWISSRQPSDIPAFNKKIIEKTNQMG